MGLVSSIYKRSSEKPPKSKAARQAQLMLETRHAIATILQVPLASIPNGWRKMAIRAHPGRQSYRSNVVAFILDGLRERTGLEPAIKGWFDAAQGRT